MWVWYKPVTTYFTTDYMIVRSVRNITYTLFIVDMSRAIAENPAPLNYAEELQKLDELQQLMLDLDDQIKESRLQSELLNLDIATMFDPDDIVRAKELSAECLNCLDGEVKMESEVITRENWVSTD